MHDLIFDPVRIVEIKPPSGLIVGVVSGGETLRQHGFFGGVEVIHHDRDVVERTDSFVAVVRRIPGFPGLEDGEVIPSVANMLGVGSGRAPGGEGG